MSICNCLCHTVGFPAYIETSYPAQACCSCHAAQMQYAPIQQKSDLQTFNDAMKEIREQNNRLIERINNVEGKMLEKYCEMYERVDKLEHKLENFIQHIYADDYGCHTRAITTCNGKFSNVFARIVALEEAKPKVVHEGVIRCCITCGVKLFIHSKEREFAPFNAVCLSCYSKK